MKKEKKKNENKNENSIFAATRFSSASRDTIREIENM